MGTLRRLGARKVEGWESGCQDYIIIIVIVLMYLDFLDSWMCSLCLFSMCGCARFAYFQCVDVLASLNSLKYAGETGNAPGGKWRNFFSQIGIC